MPLSPSLKDAVNHLHSHAQGMRAVLDVADAIADVATLEQLAAEAESRKGTAEEKLRAVEDEALNALDRLDAANANVAKAQATAADLLAKARTDADELLAYVKRKSEEATAEALADRNASLAEVDARIKAARDKLTAVNADIAAAQAELDATTAETADLVKRADDARAYLAKLAGG